MPPSQSRILPYLTCGFAARDLLNSQYYLGMRPHRRNEANTAVRGRNFAMTTFDKREEAFEKKFAIDEELKFKAEARCNRLLGLWAAQKLGITGDAAAAYARETVASAFAEGGENAVVAKVASDLAAKGIREDAVRAQMTDLMAQAVAQVRAGT
jgi:hypothetical protein